MKIKHTTYYSIGLILGILAIILYFALAERTHEGTVTVPASSATTTTPVVSAQKTIEDYLGTSATDRTTWKSYLAVTMPFSVQYPSDWTLNRGYQNTENGPGKERSGISFTIPKDMTKGTNLGPDTLISIEKNTQTKTCAADEFVSSANPGSSQTVSVNGTIWTIASGSEAAAGNRYEEIVATVPHTPTNTDPCLGVRLFIHSAAIENFDPGTVSAFDRSVLTGAYASVLESFSKK